MNNSELLTKILSGISKTLNIANRVIPIYQDTKPLLKNAKNIYDLFKDHTNNLITTKDTNIISKEKEPINKVQNNGPQFFNLN